METPSLDQAFTESLWLATFLIAHHETIDRIFCLVYTWTFQFSFQVLPDPHQRLSQLVLPPPLFITLRMFAVKPDAPNFVIRTSLHDLSVPGP